MSQDTYSGFERDVFRTVADYFLSLPEPLLTFEYYELFVNILGMYEFRNRAALSSDQLGDKGVIESRARPPDVCGSSNLRRIITAPFCVSVN